jgi:AAA domain
MPDGADHIRDEFDRAEAWRPEETISISATPYVWRDPATLPHRQWIYRDHLIRGYVTATVSGGGVGKTALTIAEALDMVSAADIFGTGIVHPLRTWLWNLEDPRDELDRRIAAAALYHEITPKQIADRLFVDSGRDNPLCITSETTEGVRIVEPIVEALIQELKNKRIDVLRVDPFVSSHSVPENDNRLIDMVVKTWCRIAGEADCAIELVHHVRKQQTGSEMTADSARGAKALVDAARSVRVLSRMTKDEGSRAGVDNHRLHVRVDLDKQNLSPPSSVATWFKLENCALPNGDNVGVAAPWRWPDPFDGLTAADLVRVQKALDGKNARSHQTADQWAGKIVANVLGFDLRDKAAKTTIKALIKRWIENGALKVVKVRCEDRKERPVVEVGKWANEA